MQNKANAAKLPELLAPAGSFEHLKAAIKAGADAVYMGGQKFGARAYAGNLHDEEMSDAIRFAHLYGSRLYLTVNTLMKDEELKHELYGFLLPFYEAGLDGVIVQDPGTASFIHRTFPGMEIHASTQMTITHLEGALAAKKLGMNRIVPARELSFKELALIKEESGLELELFIHGALCYCYSGQCLLSSWYGGRSGNRGRCAQPCRMPYKNEQGKEAYFLSLRDLCSLEMLPRIVDAGFDSLKIEGRMKNVDYVAGVTAIYRKYLDLYENLCRKGQAGTFRVEEEDIHLLEDLYCRGGFTDGYWDRHNGASMMAVSTQKNLGRKIGRIKEIKKHRIQVELYSALHPRDILVIPVRKDQEIILTVPSDPGNGINISLNVPDARMLRQGLPVYRRKNQDLSDRIQKDILDVKPVIPVSGEISIRQGKKSHVSLTSGHVTILHEGPAAGPAREKALTDYDLEKQFKKTGNTPFDLMELYIDLEENSFLPLSSLKRLRQEAYKKLEDTIASAGERHINPVRPDSFSIRRTVCSSSEEDADTADIANHAITNKEMIAIVYDEAVLNACLTMNFYTGICLPADSWNSADLYDLSRRIIDAGKKPCLSLPAIMRHGKDRWEDICTKISWDGIYVHNINEAGWLSGLTDYHGLKLAGESCYHWNNETLKVSGTLFHLDGFRLPIELDERECSRLTYPGLLPELLIYGYIPLMVTAQCQKKNAGTCSQKNGTMKLRDKKGRQLTVSSHCTFCYNRIWSDKPRNLMSEDYLELIKGLPRLAFDFFQAEASLPVVIADQYKSFYKAFATGTQRPS